jgi:hypothetical protein
MAEAVNRAAGQGAGYGLRVLNSLGTSNQSPPNQNFSSTTHAVVAGTTILILVPRPSDLLLLAIVVCKLTVGANNGLVRINPGGAGPATGDAEWGGPYNNTLMFYEVLPGVQPGTYTMQLEAAVDNAASTFQLLGSNLSVLIGIS